MAQVTGFRGLAVGWRGVRGARRPWPPVVLWVPAIAVAAAMALPLAYLLIRTFGAGDEALDLLLRSRTVRVLGQTVLLAVTVTAAATFLAVPLAWLTVRTDLPLHRMWAILTVLPLVIPSYVGAFVIIGAFGPHGLLQQVLAKPFGIESIPAIYGFPGAFLALTLFTYPYVLLTVRASLWGQDPALEEASRGLGRSARETFFRVTVPQLRPAIAAGGLLVALYTLSDFGAVSLLRFESFTHQIYLQYQGSFDRTLAAVFSLVLVGITLCVLLLEAHFRGRARYHRSTVGAVRPTTVVRLGRWRWAALAFCALVVFASLIVPLSVLSYWMAKNVGNNEPLTLVWSAARNSVYVSGLAALLAVAAAIPVATLAVRYPGRFSGAIERAAYLGFALPGIVVALALVFFSANYAPQMYQTVFLLVFAYMVLFLPQAVGSVRASLLQVSPSLEDAARGLGKRHLSALARVTLPLIRSGLLAGAALVFLTAMKELPATLLLSPIGFKSLATTIWAATDSGFLARAAAPAMLLVLAAALPMAFVIGLERRRR
ncbi:MAG: iron ABC transporter permease [Chloroflexi bacterium]|nr:iron ABC transporter permease [Chloroflexota bacterium]